MLDGCVLFMRILSAESSEPPTEDLDRKLLLNVFNYILVELTL